MTAVFDLKVQLNVLLKRMNAMKVKMNESHHELKKPVI